MMPKERLSLLTDFSLDSPFANFLVTVVAAAFKVVQLQQDDTLFGAFVRKEVDCCMRESTTKLINPAARLLSSPLYNEEEEYFYSTANDLQWVTLACLRPSCLKQVALVSFSGTCAHRPAPCSLNGLQVSSHATTNKKESSRKAKLEKKPS